MDRFLPDLKRRMKIRHSTEDEELIDILTASSADIKKQIGDFDMETYAEGKELVLERARYAYNDSLEFFYDNFQQRIMDLSLDLLRGCGDGDQSQL